MKLQLFRYYLVPVQIAITNDGEKLKLSKKEIMQKFFLKKIDFNTAQSECSYRFEKKIDDEIIHAFIGRKTLIEHSLKESDTFVKKKEEEWPFSNLIIDTNEGVQLLGFEVLTTNSSFRSPLYVLMFFAEEINKELSEYGWKVKIEPIINQQAFWDVIRSSEGKIKSVKFTYYVPNLFGTEDELSKELEGAKQNYHAQKVETNIVNDEGDLTIPNNKLISQSVEHVGKGGGKYLIILKNLKKYRSESEVRYASMDEAILKSDDPQVIVKMVKELLQ